MPVLTSRHLSAFLAIIAAAALALAYTAQYGFDLQPCVLCLYQRVPYAVIIGLGVIGYFVPAKYARALLALCAIAFASGAAIAFFQVGVEHHWWEGTTACQGQLDTSSIDALRAQIMGAKLVRCDAVAWSMFGISMAGYNFVISLALAIFTALQTKRCP